MDDTSSDHAEQEGKRYRTDERRRVDEPPDWVPLGVELTEAKTIEDDLLSILEEGSDGDAVIRDLDFVIKRFEEEIIVPVQNLSSSIVRDQTQEHASIELGYLLEASDDELGLLPSFANSADESSNHEVPEATDITSSTPFDGEMPNYVSSKCQSMHDNV